MRWLLVPLSALLGVAVGLTALAVHRDAVWVGAWPLPWGAVLAVAAPTALGLVLRRRPPVLLAFLLGWLATVLGALASGPGGDFLLMSDALGWSYLVGSVLLIAVMLAVGGRATRRRRQGTGA